MLKAYTNTSTVGTYEIAINVSTILFSLIFGGLYHIIRSKSVTQSSDLGVINQISLLSKLVILISALFYPILIFGGKFFLTFLYGEEFINSYNSLTIMFWASAFWTYSNCFAGYADARGKYSTRITLYKYLGVLVNVVLNIFLIEKMQENGAALSSVFSYIIVACAYLLEFKMMTSVDMRKLIFFSKDDLKLCRKMLKST